MLEIALPNPTLNPDALQQASLASGATEQFKLWYVRTGQEGVFHVGPQ